MSYGEGAFIAGLLHDVGELLIALSLPREYEVITAGESEMIVMGLEHAELSAAALGVWNLPVPIQTAVLYHHNPSAEPGSTDGEIRLAQVVYAADQYLNSEGHVRFIISLGIDEGAAAVLLEEFAQEREAMAKFFR